MTSKRVLSVRRRRAAWLVAVVVAMPLAVRADFADDCFHMSSAGQTVLADGGNPCLAFNDTCGGFADNSGSFAVTLTLERGGMNVAGPEMLTVLGIECPECPTCVCDGVTNERCASFEAQPGDTLIWTAAGSIDRFFGDFTDPDGHATKQSGPGYLCPNPGPAFGLVGSPRCELEDLNVDQRGKEHGQSFAFTLNPVLATSCASDIVWERQTGTKKKPWTQFATAGSMQSPSFPTAGWWRVRARFSADTEGADAVVSPWVASIELVVEKINGVSATEGDPSDVYLSWDPGKITNRVKYQVKATPTTRPGSLTTPERKRRFTWEYVPDPTVVFKPNAKSGARKTELQAPSTPASATMMGQQDMNQVTATYTLPIEGQEFSVETHVTLNILAPTKMHVFRRDPNVVSAPGSPFSLRKYTLETKVGYRVVDQFGRVLGPDAGEFDLPARGATLAFWEDLKLVHGCTAANVSNTTNVVTPCQGGTPSPTIAPGTKLFTVFGKKPSFRFQTWRTGGNLHKIRGAKKPNAVDCISATGLIHPGAQATHYDGGLKLFEVQQVLVVQGIKLNPASPNRLWFDNSGPHAEKFGGTDLTVGVEVP